MGAKLEDLYFKQRRPLFTAGLDAYAEAHTSAPPDWVQSVERETQALNTSIMLSDRCVGRMLKVLARALQPALAVDVGTFTGHSALCIAEGLGPGGRVITCEIDAGQARQAQRSFDKSPHAAKIELKVGPALDTLRAITEPVGLAFIDGEKSEYHAYFEVLLERLDPRGIICVDNTLALGSVLFQDDEAARLHPVFQGMRRAILDFNRRVHADPRVETCLLTVSDGLTLISKR